MKAEYRGAIVAEMNSKLRQGWNDVVLRATEGTFFHTFDWSEVLTKYGEESGLYSARHVMVKDEETNRIVGILPLLLCEKRFLVSLPYGDYGGPCIEPSAKKGEILKIIFGELEKIANRRVQATYMKSLPEEYLDWFSMRGYSKTPYKYTFILSTGGATLDSLWKKFERSPRQGIRRAQRKGVVVEEALEMDLMKEYYKIYVETMKRLGARIRPFLFFKVLWEVLAERGLMKVFLAKHDGKYVAGLIAFHWKKILYLYSNVSLEEYQKLSPNYLLCYTAIIWAFERNFDIDFGLSPLDRDSGLYQFKKRWGGTPKLLFEARKRYRVSILDIVSRLWIKTKHVLSRA